jgi:NIMA (never in mitosis gene a)-related kinase
MARASERIGSALAQHGYEQVRTVGEGSFGKAILVKSLNVSPYSNEKPAIVKMVDIGKATKKEREDALQESQVLSSLKHPSIVKYRNNFLAEGWLCIVMDYCEGGDLSGRIKKTKAKASSFSEEQVLWWFTQSMQGLKYIHDMHILHRDLKSGNLFLSKAGNIKIGDFGIAKVLECTAACAQTQIGTPYYLCPEICKGKPYSWGSDIWAMGCILHELCALRVPFDGHDLKSLIQNITKAPTPKLPARYSRPLQDLLNCVLNRNPNSRPEASDVLEIPIVRDMADRMDIEAQKGEQRGSEAAVDSEAPQREDASVESEAGRKPESVVASVASSGQYSDSAGSYYKRERVEYLSSTHNEWLPATVIDVDAKGLILMDVKPNTWISLEVQAEKVRPRSERSEASECKARKQPSAAAVPCSAREARPAQQAQAPASARRSVRDSAAEPPRSARHARPAGDGVRNQRPSVACRDGHLGGKYARNPNMRART